MLLNLIARTLSNQYDEKALDYINYYNQYQGVVKFYSQSLL